METKYLKYFLGWINTAEGGGVLHTQPHPFHRIHSEETWREEKKSFPNKQVIVRTRTRVFFMLAWWVAHPEDDVLVFPEFFSLPLPPLL